MWCLVVFQHDLHGQCLPQGKEKLLLKDSLSKRQSRLCTLPLEYYDVITKQMNFNFPCHCNQWKHQAKRQWLGAKCGCSHIFYNISAWNLLKCNETNFNSSFGDHELLSFVCFSLRGELGNEKKHSLYCGKFRSVLVAFTNTKTFMEGETKYIRSMTKQDFPVKTKHQSLTSLASIRLVPGDDRAARHICIRCIVYLNSLNSSAKQVCHKRTYYFTYRPCYHIRSRTRIALYSRIFFCHSQLPYTIGTILGWCSM